MAERGRLFVALELPGPVSEALVRWRAPVLAAASADGLRAVAPEWLHVTLCFLGEVDVHAATAAFTAALPGAAGGPVALREPLWLPRRRPRVLAVGLDDGGGWLQRLQSELAGALAGAGLYRVERRRFLPHVTVARVRAPLSPLPELPSAPDACGRASFVNLMRSRLGRGGARCERVVSVELA